MVNKQELLYLLCEFSGVKILHRKEQTDACLGLIDHIASEGKISVLSRVINDRSVSKTVKCHVTEKIISK